MQTRTIVYEAVLKLDNHSVYSICLQLGLPFLHAHLANVNPVFPERDLPQRHLMSIDRELPDALPVEIEEEALLYLLLGHSI
jgi:hypothetical protein